MSKLAIIGTAGRKEDLTRINLDLYNDMKRAIFKFLQERPKIKTVISGGAATSDHLAVQLFLKDIVKKLELYLPCEFDMDKVEYLDNGSMDWRENPARTANYYHRMFHGHTYAPGANYGIKSLAEVKAAIEKGAKVKVEKGFMERNTLVAKNASILIAFTFGDGPRLKDGGSADTVRKFIEFNDGKNKNAYHFDLNTMTLHQGAII